MQNREIEIELPLENTGSQKGQYQEWVARFCYASAQLSPALVEHFLGLMETCSDSDSVSGNRSPGNA